MAATDTSSVARSVSIVTLGCGRNEVDSDQLAGMFHRAGTAVVDDPTAADVVLVNTCTFIAPAKQESIDTVLEACQLKEDGQARAVLVVGCMAQRYPQELAEAIPEADAVVGFDGYANLPAIVDQVLTGRQTDRVIGVGPAHPGSRPSGGAAGSGPGVSLGRSLPLMIAPSPAQDPAPDLMPTPDLAPVADDTVSVDVDATTVGLPVVERVRTNGDGDLAPVATGQDLLDRVPASGPRFPLRRHDGRPWAYLKIASGCDRVCTFCAIPSFRGRFRSRPLDEILTEAAWLAQSGVRELVLVSENTTSWGKDLPGGRALQPTLLRELAAIDGIERIRLMYLQPAELTDPLLEAIADIPEVASYVDLSLQHVSGPVVKRMARSGDHERFGALVDRIRGLDPAAVFRSSFILGFPGETEHDVDVLCDFLAEHRLDWVGFFPFSREDGTSSATMDGDVPDEVVRARLERVADLQEQLADEAARAFVGRRLDVLVETHDDSEHAVFGRSYREAPETDGDIQLVTRDGQPVDVPIGRMVTAEVVDTIGVDLVAAVDVEVAGG